MEIYIPSGSQLAVQTHNGSLPQEHETANIPPEYPQLDFRGDPVLRVDCTRRDSEGCTNICGPGAALVYLAEVESAQTADNIRPLEEALRFNNALCAAQALLHACKLMDVPVEVSRAA